MYKSITALLVGAFLLTSCTPTNPEAKDGSKKSGGMCVAGFVEDSPGKGTLDIFFPSDFSPDVQSIEGVSIETAEKVTQDIGRC